MAFVKGVDKKQISKWHNWLKKPRKYCTKIKPVLRGRTYCPRGIVADGDVFGVQVPGQYWHKLWDARVDVGEAGLGEVPQQGEGGLSHLGHGVLDALEQKLHDVGGRHHAVNVGVQAFCQTGEQVQSHDHKVLVRLVELVGLLRVRHLLVECLLDQGHAPPIHWLAVGKETLLQ